MSLPQKSVPGIVGISTYVDFAYQKHMQLAAVAAAQSSGPINQLRSVLATLDFNLLIDNLKSGRRDAAEDQVAAAVEALARAGADFIVVTSGTTSTLTGRARQRVALPFLDLAAACFKPAPPPGPIGLLSTSYAASGGMFQAAAARHGSSLVLPTADLAKRVDDAIFGDLVCGSASDTSIAVFREALDQLSRAGAKSIILGNTDLTLIAEQLRYSAPVPLIDSAEAHARDAARAALSGEI